MGWWQGGVELHLCSDTSRKKLLERTPILLILSERVQRCSVGPEGSCEESGRLGNKDDTCTQCHESGICYITLQSQ